MKHIHENVCKNELQQKKNFLAFFRIKCCITAAKQMSLPAGASSGLLIQQEDAVVVAKESAADA